MVWKSASLRIGAIALAIASLAIACTGNDKPSEILVARASPVPMEAKTAQPAENPPPIHTPTPTIQPRSTPTVTPTFAAVNWDVYHSDPQHLWNRLFRQFYGRTTKDGKEYGRDALDPLLWEGTTSLLRGPAYQQTLQVLDEFLATRENLITDPLKRAMLQRDLWAVFDWLEGGAYDPSNQRQALESRLAQAIQRLALTKQQIEALPNNYQAAESSHAFPASYETEKSSVAFLPESLFTLNGDWVPVGREGGPIAMTHVQSHPFWGRSVFLLFIRVPGGREATLSFLHRLQDGAASLTEGTEVALVRRMLLVDTQGSMIASPIVESIQLRHFSSTGQSFHKFQLSRDRLFSGETGGLKPVEPDEKEFPVFGFHPVDFSNLDSGEAEERKAVTLSTCRSCHEDHFQGIVGLRSILSYSRARFPLPDQQRLVLTETTPTLEAQVTIMWKLQHGTWKTLQALWRR